MDSLIIISTAEEKKKFQSSTHTQYVDLIDWSIDDGKKNLSLTNDENWKNWKNLHATKIE